MPGLVPAEEQAGAVVALDEHAHAAADLRRRTAALPPAASAGGRAGRAAARRPRRGPRPGVSTGAGIGILRFGAARSYGHRRRPATARPQAPAVGFVASPAAGGRLDPVRRGPIDRVDRARTARRHRTDGWHSRPARDDHAPGRPPSPRRREQPTADRRNSVLIVGAGPGGLAAALLLARAGLDVHVVERLPRVGGRCSAIEADGFRFDLGPTFFLYPRVLERIFQLVGRDLRAEVPMVRLDPQYRLVFGGRRATSICTPDVGRMEAEVAKLSPADAAERPPVPRRQPRQAGAVPPVPGAPVPRLARPARAGTC